MIWGKMIMKKIIISFMLILTLVLVMSITAFSIQEIENNNSVDTATEISVNTNVSGNLSSTSDVDWYRFTVEKDGYFHVDFQHELVDSSSAYWQIRLYDSSGVNFIDGNNSYFSVVGNSNNTTTTYGVTPGTYYIKLTDYYYTGVDYNFNVVFTPSSEWETENNNEKNSADEISLNKTYNGSFTTDGDVDWYKFTITENGYFYIDFKHELVNSSYTYWQIRLYDETGVSFIDGNDSYFAVVGNSNNTTTTYGVTPGTYYIKLTDYYYTGVDYNFNVVFTPSSEWETENNNSKGNANNISLNSSINGALTTDGDGDWYKFTVTSGCEIAITLNHATLNTGYTYWVVNLYDSSAVTKLSTLNCAGNVSSSTSEYLSVSSGTYYISITDYYYVGTDYILTIQEKHDCVGTFVTTKEPTCTEAGTQDQICSICGKMLDTQVAPATGHSSDNWEIEKEATCDTDGKRHGTCQVCGEYVSEAIPMLGHVYGEWQILSGNVLIPPIVREKNCSLCDDVQTYKDWSNIWVLIVAIVIVIAIVIGIIGYIKAFSKNK